MSWAASYFTKQINLVSIVGGDFPKGEMDGLKKIGVDLEGLEIKDTGKTFFWAGRYHMNKISRDTLATDLNVLDDFNPVGIAEPGKCSLCRAALPQIRRP